MFKDIFNKLRDATLPNLGEPIPSGLRIFAKFGNYFINTSIFLTTVIYIFMLVFFPKVLSDEDSFTTWFYFFLLLFNGANIAIIYFVSIMTTKTLSALAKKGRDGRIAYGIALKWIAPATFCFFIGLVLLFAQLTPSETEKKIQAYANAPERNYIKDTVARQLQFGWDVGQPIPVDEELLANPPKEERFGMIMGVTKLEEAKEILRNRGAEFRVDVEGDQIWVEVRIDPLIKEYIPNFVKALMGFTSSKRLFNYEIQYRRDGDHTHRFLHAAFLEKGFKKKKDSNELEKGGTSILFENGLEDKVNITFDPLRNEWENGDPKKIKEKIKKGIKDI